MWPCLGPPLTTMHTLCTSGFMDDVMTARNGPYGAWLIGRILKVSHKGAALGASEVCDMGRQDISVRRCQWTLSKQL